jgi:hypothetical protein
MCVDNAGETAFSKWFWLDVFDLRMSNPSKNTKKDTYLMLFQMKITLKAHPNRNAQGVFVIFFPPFLAELDRKKIA